MYECYNHHSIMNDALKQTSEKTWLYLSVFTAGMTTLAVELSSSRLLGNVFGTTNIVWANIIGLILIYLAAGYYLGGKWADRSPHQRTYYQILIWGAFLAGLAPLLSRPVLRWAANAVSSFDAPIMAGSFITVLILLSVPITLLGTISPFAIRLSIKETDQAGSISGRIYAVSTVGSIFGTFIPVLLLIPAVGTARTFLLFSMLLQLVALVGLWLCCSWKLVLRYAWMPFLLLISAYFFLEGPIKSDKWSIFETESEYNYIQVLDVNGTRVLLLNEGQAEHSLYIPGVGPPYEYGTWEFFLSAPYFNAVETIGDSPIERLGIVGLAGGTIAKQYTDIHGEIPIDGWEIDPKIIEVGREYFDMNEKNLNAIVADGRWGLSRSPYQYSVIAVDAYRPPYIPWQLTTVEFFQEVHDKLDENGVLVINVGRTPEDRRLIEAMVGTIGAVFDTVYVVDVPNSFNSIVYATVQATTLGNLTENISRIEAEGRDDVLLGVLKRTLENIQPTPATGVVFTDDHAPVESLINSIVIRFALRSMDQLQFLPYGES
jgi:predicted membrane-bound spermidine synthase